MMSIIISENIVVWIGIGGGSEGENWRRAMNEWRRGGHTCRQKKPINRKWRSRKEREK